MKLGISIKIDVTKIDKARIHKGKKGKYLNLTTFIDTENDGQFGEHGFISQSLSKEEREQGVKTPILGNCKVFFTKASDAEKAHQAPPPAFPEAFPTQQNVGGFNQDLGDYDSQSYQDQSIDDVPF